jgi:hypothetical protein
MHAVILETIFWAVTTAATAGRIFLALAPAFCAAQTALDLDGKSVNPRYSTAGRSSYSFSWGKTVQFSGRYAPTIQRISNEHQNEHQKDARFYLIFPDIVQPLSTRSPHLARA